MTKTPDFSIIRKYSSILNFQKRAEDEYSLFCGSDEMVIHYRRSEPESELHEEIAVRGIGIEIIKALLQYCSENAVRTTQWTDAIGDYCREHGGLLRYISPITIS